MAFYIKLKNYGASRRSKACFCYLLMIILFIAGSRTGENIPVIREPIQFSTHKSRLEELLHIRANQEKFVMLTAFTFSYKEMFLNFKCNLDRVGMKDYLVVAAFDKKVYEWGIIHDLPIFLVPGPLGGNTTEMEGGAFRTPGFNSASKAKAIAVLTVLEAGYSVVWSDVDVVWFENPFAALSTCMAERTTMCIQSDTPLEQGDPTNMLNSGMYVAPYSPVVKAAFRDIIKHQKRSDLDDQPSFNEILCGSPSIKLDVACIYRPTSQEQEHLVLGDPSVTSVLLTVKTLDRFHFPHGAVRVGRESQNIFELGIRNFTQITSMNVIMAHNNWIVGVEMKEARQKSSRWWFLDDYGACKSRDP